VPPLTSFLPVRGGDNLYPHVANLAPARRSTKLFRMPDAPLPDRGHLLTEQRFTASNALDALSIEQMLALINTQDATVTTVVRKALPQVAAVVRLATASLRQGGRLIYIGAGTSGRLGVLDASECPPTFHSLPEQVIGIIAGGDSALRRSSEGKEDDPQGAKAVLDELAVNARDTVLGIAAGGTTPYVWGALDMAHQRGAKTSILICVPLRSLLHQQRAPVVRPDVKVSPPAAPKLPAHLDVCIELPVGPEVVTGSTRMKAGTATKMVLNMISTATMVQLGKVWGNLMVDLRATNAKLRDRAARIVSSQCDVSREQALQVLDAADGKVKVALVMARRQVDAATAQHLLDEHHQQLRPILGSPR